MAASNETPMVGTIHWDDVLSQFRIKISAEFDTPFGHFEPEPVHFTAADLATALSIVLDYWTGGPGSSHPAAVPAFPLGDKAVIKAAVDRVWP